MRRQNIEEVSKIAHPMSTDSIERALEDENERVRSSAAGALGNLGDRKAAPVLAAMCISYQHGFSLLKVDLQAALDTLKNQTQWFPLRDWVFRLYGQALWMNDDLEGAKEQFYYATQRHPTVDNYLALAHYYIESEEIPAAQTQIKRALEMAKRLYTSYYLALTQDVVHWLSKDKDLRFKLLEKRRKTYQKRIDLKRLQESHFWREKALAALQEIIDAVAQS